MLLAEDKIIDEDDDINRSAGLAVGLVGTKKAIVLGPRTTGYRAPAPLIIVYQEHDGTYSHFHVDEDYNPNTTIPGYAGNENFDLQPTGIALDDLDGNGAIDIIPVRVSCVANQKPCIVAGCLIILIVFAGQFLSLATHSRRLSSRTARSLGRRESPGRHATGRDARLLRLCARSRRYDGANLSR